jgi:hypothetical protein
MENMTSGQDTLDRRKHQRFQVQEGACAVFKPDFCNWGQIVDVSRGGLGFRYTGGEQLAKASYLLGISLATVGFYLHDIPFKAIWDCDITKEATSSFPKTTQCGVQFGKLTPYQISQLEYFILNHTTGEVGESFA